MRTPLTAQFPGEFSQWLGSLAGTASLGLSLVNFSFSHVNLKEGLLGTPRKDHKTDGWDLIN